jgi:hypothetical protein
MRTSSNLGRELKSMWAVFEFAATNCPDRDFLRVPNEACATYSDAALPRRLSSLSQRRRDPRSLQPIIRHGRMRAYIASFQVLPSEVGAVKPRL